MAKPRRVSRKKIPEEIIARAIVTKTVPGSVTDPTEIPAGTEVGIARIINTPIGHRFRIFQTTKWVGLDSIKCAYDENLVVDYRPNEERVGVNLLTTTYTSVKKSTKGLKTHKGAVIKNVASTEAAYHNITGRKRKMDTKELKKQIREAILNMNPGDRVKVAMLSTVPSETRYDAVRPYAGQVVEGELVETKKGRGKGGSQLMVLKLNDEETLTVGTPHTEAMLHMVMPDGSVVGYENEAEAPKFFEVNVDQATALRAKFNKLVGTEGVRVRVESTTQEFDGDFTVTLAEKTRGRYGQIRLSLRADDGQETQLWSYRHSGVVKSFEVLSDETTGDATSGAADAAASG